MFHTFYDTLYGDGCKKDCNMHVVTVGPPTPKNP